jgi:hypothetical protein
MEKLRNTFFSFALEGTDKDATLFDLNFQISKLI